MDDVSALTEQYFAHRLGFTPEETAALTPRMRAAIIRALDGTHPTTPASPWPPTRGDTSVYVTLDSTAIADAMLRVQHRTTPPQ